MRFARSITIGFALLLVGLLIFAAPKQALAASLQPVEDFGPNPGQLDMYIHLPPGHGPDSPMVVALHGCDQQASDFDDETGLLDLADAYKFVLVFPQQRQTNNEKQCFNWFEDEDTRAHQGESGSIRNMIGFAIDTHHIDSSKIFVLGLSAGGSMTAVLMANYPELFQGGAIIAGTPYECNRPSMWTWAMWWSLNLSWGDAYSASYACGLFDNSPTERASDEWGDLVRKSSGTTPEQWPKISLWQGDADEIVNPANQMELVKQWSNVHGIDQTPDRTAELNGIKHSVYQDADGVPLLETYEIAEFDHAIAVDPGTDPGQCGIVAPYVADADICSSLQILKFWGVLP